jgi:hypothetical protein
MVYSTNILLCIFTEPNSGHVCNAVVELNITLAKSGTRWGTKSHLSLRKNGVPARYGIFMIIRSLLLGTFNSSQNPLVINLALS